MYFFPRYYTTVIVNAHCYTGKDESSKKKAKENAATEALRILSTGVVSILS